jgi:hypothetical protein
MAVMKAGSPAEPAFIVFCCVAARILMETLARQYLDDA